MTKTIPLRVSTSKEVLYQNLEGQGILLDLKKACYYGLDSVATRMWELLTKEEHTEKVIKQLLSEYNVNEETLRKDLSELIYELVKLEIVTIND